jgi:hypothetical protein
VGGNIIFNKVVVDFFAQATSQLAAAVIDFFHCFFNAA